MAKQRIPFSVRTSQTSIQRKILSLLIFVGAVPMAILLGTAAGGFDADVAILVAIACQVGGLAWAYHQSNAIFRQATEICQTIDDYQQGDFDSRSEISTTDELGQAAEALNKLGDVVCDLLQSDDERKRIQSSIVELKSEIRQIAAGDLTISARAKSDLTGSIAESINQMTEQLRSIVTQVQSAACQATELTDQIQATSMTIAQDSDVQATQVYLASQRLVEMTDAFQNLSVLTEETVDTAVEARKTATDGFKAVTATVDGMQRIRDQVQGTSKRIKRLGESSQEIGEIVQLISDITDRTSILALNASIQAAMAGDAGHGFAVVAEEIEQLADNGTAATKQIAKLIRAIQNETSEVITDMEESTREVVAGSRLATQAGETLFEIDKVSSQLVDLIQNASAYAADQANMANQIAAEMSEIASTARDSSEQTRTATQLTNQLSETVLQLQHSCDQFKLSPGGPTNKTPVSPAFRIRTAPTGSGPSQISWGKTGVRQPSPSVVASPSQPNTPSPSRPARRVNPTIMVDSAAEQPAKPDASSSATERPGNRRISDQLPDSQSTPDSSCVGEDAQPTFPESTPPQIRHVAQTMMFSESATNSVPDGSAEGEFDEQLLSEVQKVQSELDAAQGAADGGMTDEQQEND